MLALLASISEIEQQQLLSLVSVVVKLTVRGGKSKAFQSFRDVGETAFFIRK